jgi:hypothetical protein
MDKKLPETSDAGSPGAGDASPGALEEQLAKIAADGKAAERRERKLKERANHLALANLARCHEDQGVLYAPLDALRFGIPLTRPPAGITTWECKTVVDGHPVLVRLVADPETGLPFGNDLALLTLCATAFQVLKCPEDRTIRVASGSAIARWLYPKFREPGQETPSWARRQVSEAVARWAGCFIRFFALDGASLDDLRLKFENHTIVEAAELGFGTTRHKRESKAKRNQHRHAQLEFTDWIRFSPAGAELLARNAPTDQESFYALLSNPLALRLYLWEATRSWQLARRRAQGAVRVRLDGDTGLVKQLGMRSSLKHARQELKEAQKRVREVWRDCPNRLVLDGRQPEREGMFLYPGHAFTTQDGRADLPGLIHTVDVDLAPAANSQTPGRLSLKPKPPPAAE